MSLEITFGPMFSGKTTYLIEKITKIISVRNMNLDSAHKPFEPISGFKGLIINSKSDSRNKSVFNLSTHSNIKIDSNEHIHYVSVDKLNELDDIFMHDYTYVSIDECQFFEDLVEMVTKWLKLKKHIHCSGLIADTNRNKFGNLLELFPLADCVEQKKAICVKCANGYNRGVFTKRKSNSNTELIFVSGKEDYFPVCGEHF